MSRSPLARVLSLGLSTTLLLTVVISAPRAHAAWYWGKVEFSRRISMSFESRFMDANDIRNLIKDESEDVFREKLREEIGDLSNQAITRNENFELTETSFRGIQARRFSASGRVSALLTASADVFSPVPSRTVDQKVIIQIRTYAPQVGVISLLTLDDDDSVKWFIENLGKVKRFPPDVANKLVSELRDAQVTHPGITDESVDVTFWTKAGVFGDNFEFDRVYFGQGRAALRSLRLDLFSRCAKWLSP